MSRVHHPACCIEVEAWPAREAFCCDDAEVWIDTESILISFFDDEGMVVLEGRPEPSGGWQLVARPCGTLECGEQVYRSRWLRSQHRSQNCEKVQNLFNYCKPVYERIKIPIYRITNCVG